MLFAMELFYFTMKPLLPEQLSFIYRYSYIALYVYTFILVCLGQQFLQTPGGACSIALNIPVTDIGSLLLLKYVQKTE